MLAKKTMTPKISAATNRVRKAAGDMLPKLLELEPEIIGELPPQILFAPSTGFEPVHTV